MPCRGCEKGAECDECRARGRCAKPCEGEIVSQRCTGHKPDRTQCKLHTRRAKKCWQHERKEEGLRIKKSTIPGAGLGLFVAKGHHLTQRDSIPYTGEIMTKDEIDKACPGDTVVAYGLALPKGKYVNACKSTDEAARFANDPQGPNPNNKGVQRPNAELTNTPNGSKAMIKPTKNIGSNDHDVEIFVDYGKDYWKTERNKSRREARAERARAKAAAEQPLIDGSEPAARESPKGKERRTRSLSPELVMLPPPSDDGEHEYRDDEGDGDYILPPPEYEHHFASSSSPPRLPKPTRSASPPPSPFQLPHDIVRPAQTKPSFRVIPRDERGEKTNVMPLVRTPYELNLDSNWEIINQFQSQPDKLNFHVKVPNRDNVMTDAVLHVVLIPEEMNDDNLYGWPLIFGESVNPIVYDESSGNFPPFPKVYALSAPIPKMHWKEVAGILGLVHTRLLWGKNRFFYVVLTQYFYGEPKTGRDFKLENEQDKIAIASLIFRLANAQVVHNDFTSSNFFVVREPYADMDNMKVIYMIDWDDAEKMDDPKSALDANWDALGYRGALADEVYNIILRNLRAMHEVPTE